MTLYLFADKHGNLLGLVFSSAAAFHLYTALLGFDADFTMRECHI